MGFETVSGNAKENPLATTTSEERLIHLTKEQAEVVIGWLDIVQSEGLSKRFNEVPTRQIINYIESTYPELKLDYGHLDWSSKQK